METLATLAERDSAPQVLESEWMDTEEGLETLEDSLIGNDVLLEECKRQSDHLCEVFSKCMAMDRCAVPLPSPDVSRCLAAVHVLWCDLLSAKTCSTLGDRPRVGLTWWRWCRHGHRVVRLEQPDQLQCPFQGLTLQSVVRMLGDHCAALKPYQVAAVGFMACLIQRSVRGCIVSSEPALGARTIVRPLLPHVPRLNFAKHSQRCLATSLAATLPPYPRLSLD